MPEIYSSATKHAILPPPVSQPGFQQGSSSSMTWDANGHYSITGSGGDDQIRVSEWNPPMTLEYNPNKTTQFLKVEVNGDAYFIPIDGGNAAKSIAINAGTGNDSVFVDPNVTFPLFINGGAGNDYLKGGSGPNALIGGAGNDILIGGKKDDLLLGGPGCDTIIGNGGRDMYSTQDLFRRLQEGRCGQPKPCDPPIVEKPKCPPSQEPTPPPAPQPPPKDCGPVPTPPSPPLPPPYSPPPPQQPQQPLPPKPKPQTPPRPKLSDLLAAVDTHDEKGFKSGRDMTKNLLAAFYESPAKLRSVLSSISSAKERDDAVASFVRALLESGPDGARMLKELPADIKKTLFNYIDSGNAWSANKKAIDMILAKLSGNPTTRFNDKETMDFFRRYEGMVS